jgi:hypothetical protein
VAGMHKKMREEVRKVEKQTKTLALKGETKENTILVN